MKARLNECDVEPGQPINPARPKHHPPSEFYEAKSRQTLDNFMGVLFPGYDHGGLWGDCDE